MNGMTKRRKLLFGTATVAICGTLTLSMTSEAPLFLYPITPSLPPGLYVRAFEPPAVGMIAAFHVPEAAKRYKASIGEAVHDDFLFMKPIIAGPGAHVCIRPSHELFVNNESTAIITRNDRNGRRLPLWGGCRELTAHEFFTLSACLKNSFDSRHYGPIRLSNVTGTYRAVSNGPLGKCPRSPRS
jgi:type IV secretory pathway protease TraF